MKLTIFYLHSAYQAKYDEVQDKLEADFVKKWTGIFEIIGSRNLENQYTLLSQHHNIIIYTYHNTMNIIVSQSIVDFVMVGYITK